MNILILSVGTRNKVVQYFKKELKGIGTVVATDASELAPALYEADKFYIVPKIYEDNYLNIIFDICKENDIDAVLSLIDPELSILAKNIEIFKSIGVTPIISDYDIVELCFDKFKMFEYLTQNNFKTVRSYVELESFYKDLESNKINFPVFVKPVKGSASININKVTSKKELEVLFAEHNNLMIQEFMTGKEFGADVYIDMISGKVVSIFAKEKLLMRAGETDKSVSIKDDKLFNLIIKFVEQVGFKGIIDIDLFKKDNEYYVSEVNPRFGGGYPHGHVCGVNVPGMIVNNIFKEKINPSIIGNYKENTYMMKYNEIKIKEDIKQ